MKNLLILLCLIYTTVINGQNYVRVFDLSGITPSSTEEQIMEDAANQIVTALGPEFTGQFKVYDFSYYVYNDLMSGLEEPAIWAHVKSQIPTPYYILFGRESDHLGNFNKVRVELKLPTTHQFRCLDTDYLKIIQNTLELPNNELYVNNPNCKDFSSFLDVHLSSLHNLEIHILKLNQCCDAQTGNWSPNCGNCRYGINDVMGLLASKGYMRMNASSVAVQSHSYQNIESNLKISMQIEGIQVNFTDHLEALAASNPGSVFVKVRQLTNANCDSISLFEEIRSNADYAEDVVLVNYSGIYVVYSKLASKPQSRILPWLAVEALKRIAMAATGGIIEVGLSVILEYYIGGHPTFSAAWDAVEIAWLDVAAAAAEGAFSEAKYASVAITAITEVVKWIIATPYDNYLMDPSGSSGGIRGPGWIAELGKQMTKAFANAVLEEVLLKKVEKFADVLKKHGASFSPELKSKLGKLAYNTVTKLDKSELKSFLGRWKELKLILPKINSAATWMITDPKYLKNVMDAVKHQGDKFKILQQKLGNSHKPTNTLVENMKIASGRTKKDHEAAHHIVAGGSNNPFAIKTREKLQNLGIDINESSNGVFLTKNIASKINEDDIAHSTLHTKIYYEEVWKRIQDINDPILFREELEKIGTELRNNTFKYR